MAKKIDFEHEEKNLLRNNWKVIVTYFISKNKYLNYPFQFLKTISGWKLDNIKSKHEH